METTEAIEVKATPVPEVDDLQKVYQEYLQKCCEAGQIQYQLEQLDGQQKQMEKQLDVVQQAIRKAAAKHRELQRTSLAAAKPEVKEEAPH